MVQGKNILRKVKIYDIFRVIYEQCVAKCAKQLTAFPSLKLI
jgi:hypothetical protein